MRRFGVLCAMAVAMMLVTSGVLRADGGFHGFSSHGFPWFGYGNNGPAAYALGNIPAPPYFALHPPVYYSHSIARPYGLSPFACPHGCHGLARVGSARVVVNPFIERKPVEQPTQQKAGVAATPHRVANPFFQAERKLESGLAIQSSR